ncbi:MAG TPA: hypothetical protein VND93_29800 [Myxococcales bacterium]|nr:hypothetical protein [Myxococcales bacterium]
MGPRNCPAGAGVPSTVALSGLALFLLLASAPPPSKADAYRASIAALATDREQLAAEFAGAARARARAQVLERARERALRGIVDELLPPWSGTPWRLDGTSQTPGEGFIACSYLVTTVLRDAGFRVPRARLAQAPSEQIARSLAPPGAVARLTSGDPARVLEHIRARGPGLYLVGLDYHVGFVVNAGERMDFCHSSVLPPGTALCEPAATAAAFSSTVHVVAPLLTDWMVQRWLEGARFPLWQLG